ncbi:hypothetical protein [Neobacillus sp. LXY-4]|uniref:hypothetical protein n=1 Tax=Neobacillus sp. LXY-4 TaxID=3379826 RepID=UPI003EE17455
MRNSLLVPLQFLFPILGILLILTEVVGSYTIQTSLIVLLVGFLFSIFLVTYKKLILWGMLNIFLTVLIIVGGLIVYIGMLASGV